MTWLWITLAFLAGCIVWYQLGEWMVSRAFKGHNFRRRVLANLPDDSLVKLEAGVTEEILKRQVILDDRNIQASL